MAFNAIRLGEFEFTFEGEEGVTEEVNQVVWSSCWADVQSNHLFSLYGVDEVGYVRTPLCHYVTYMKACLIKHKYISKSINFAFFFGVEQPRWDHT